MFTSGQRTAATGGRYLVVEPLRLAQAEAAEFTELVANEVSAVVLRDLCRSALDWMSRALFGDNFSLQDLFDTGVPHSFDGGNSSVRLALLPLFGRPVETKPYTAASFPDYTTGDRTLDDERLAYAAVCKDFCMTGPDYWLHRFLQMDNGNYETSPDSWSRYSPMSRERRVHQHLAVDQVRAHFLGQHDGIFAGLLQSGSGPDESFAEGASILLSWGLLFAACKHWYQTSHNNIMSLRLLVSSLGMPVDPNSGLVEDATLNEQLAQDLSGAMFVPMEVIVSTNENDKSRSRATLPPAQYRAYNEARAVLPREGDSARSVAFSAIANFQQNAREELDLLENACAHLAEHTHRYFSTLPGYECEQLQLMYGQWPFASMREAVDGLSSWVFGAGTADGPDDTGAYLAGPRSDEYWHGQWDEELGKHAYWTASDNWSRYLSALVRLFDARVMQRLQPKNAEHINGAGSGRCSQGLAHEIARNFINVDCSLEDRRGASLPPDDHIRFQAARYRFFVGLVGPFSQLEGYRHPGDSALYDLPTAQLDEVFGTAADYLRSSPARKAEGKPQDDRTDGLLGLDPVAHYRDVTKESTEASLPGAGPSEEECLAEELVRLRTRITAAKAVSVFVGMADVLRVCRAFEKSFDNTDEPTAIVEPTFGRIYQAISELRSKVRIQRAFWGSPVTPEDVRQHNLAYWTELDQAMESVFLLLRGIENGVPAPAGFWLPLRELVGRNMRLVLTSVVLYTIQNIEYEASERGDQATVDHQLATDGVYSLLRRGLEGGNASPWDRVVRSSRQKRARDAFREFTDTEVRMQQARVTQRQRTWCNESRLHVLQHIRRSTTLRVESLQHETMSSNVCQARVDQWERDRLRSLAELRSQSLQGDGVSDNEQALRLFSLALPAPFYTDCDTVVVALKVSANNPYHNELVREIKQARHYSAELMELLLQCDQDLRNIVWGVEALRQQASQSDTYFMWASFDPLALAPLQDFDSETAGHTFYFQVRLYRTFEFYHQWLALGFASTIADGALRFRRDALRLYEQTPYVSVGEYERPADGLALMGKKPPKPAEVHMGAPRYYRALYVLQDLGCTSSTSYGERANMGCRDAWKQKTEDGEWVGLPMPCHDGRGGDAEQTFRSDGYAEVCGTWHDRLVRASAILAQMTHDTGSRRNYRPTDVFGANF